MPRASQPAPSKVLQTLQARITSLMDAAGLSPNSLSVKAGIGRAGVREILIGRNSSPGIGTLLAIARALNCDLAYLVGEQDEANRDLALGVSGIPVVGSVEAGAFRTDTGPEPWLEERDFERISAPRPARRPHARTFAFRVRGDSMNAAPQPIVEGSFVLCIDIADAEGEIVDGEIYVVRQTTDGGQTFEWTVKRAHVFRDRFELAPESTNQKHKAIIIPRTEEAPDGLAIEAIGVVYAVYSQMGRYS